MCYCLGPVGLRNIGSKFGANGEAGLMASFKSLHARESVTVFHALFFKPTTEHKHENLLQHGGD